MTAQEWLFFGSAVLLAFPALRALYCLWLARRKDAKAEKMKLGLAELEGQPKITAESRIRQLETASHDLIEFTGLLPPWIQWMSFFGILLNLLARLLPLCTS